MKLRNKQTGEIMDLECITVFDRPDKYNTGDAIDDFYTIAELNAHWEDYKPAEPLIKDEKIRKAVRAWAEANGVFEVQFGYDDGGNWSLSDTTHDEWICIEFKSDFPLSLNGCRRTIKELCGEEEEWVTD